MSYNGYDHQVVLLPISIGTLAGVLILFGTAICQVDNAYLGAKSSAGAHRCGLIENLLRAHTYTIGRVALRFNSSVITYPSLTTTVHRVRRTELE